MIWQASAEVDSVSVKEDGRSALSFHRRATARSLPLHSCSGARFFAEKYDLEQNVSDLGQTGWLTRHLRALGFDVFGKSHRESSRGDFDASQPDSNPQLSVRRTLQSSSQKKTPSTSAKKRPPPPKTKKTSSSPKKKSPPPKTKKTQSPPPKTKKKQSPPPKTKKKQPPPPKTNTLSPPKKKSPPPPKKKSPPPPKKKKQPPPRQLSSLPTGSSSARASAGSEKVKVQVRCCQLSHVSVSINFRARDVCNRKGCSSSVAGRGCGGAGCKYAAPARDPGSW